MILYKYKNVEFILEDWRLTQLNKKQLIQNTKKSYKNYELIELGKNSFLSEIEDRYEDFRVPCYNHELMKQHHCIGKHEYLITKRIFDVDFIINVPKLKTHIKTGITCALKNLIGINGHKEFLPHHIKGAYLEGGDNYIFGGKFKELFEDFDDFFWKTYKILIL